MQQIESQLESDAGQPCIRFLNLAQSRDKRRLDSGDYHLIPDENGQDYRHLGNILELLGFFRRTKYSDGLCEDDEEYTKLSVRDVVNISLTYNCPVKTRTVLEYADLIAQGCEN